MGKISKLDMVIKDLRNAATVIKDAADTLAEMFSGTAAEETAPASAEPELTLEQIRDTLAEKSLHGHTAEICSLLRKHGAVKLLSITRRFSPIWRCLPIPSKGHAVFFASSSERWLNRPPSPYIEKPHDKPTLVSKSDKRSATDTAKNNFMEEM